MKKLHFLVLAIVIASCLVLAACGEGAETTTTTTTTTTSATTTTTTTTEPEVIDLTFSYHAPPNASMAVAIFEPWANDLEEACGGRVKITRYPGGTLLSTEDALDGVITGICDMAQLATEDYPGRFPMGVISELPLVFPSTAAAGPAYHEWLLKYAAATELKDVQLLLAAPMWGQHYYGNKPVETLEDFGGMKIRCSGKQSALIVQALGATPIEVETGDMFSALDTGLIEGTFFTWSGYFAFGFKDVTTYKTECSLVMPVHLIVMNKQKYDSLPADIKAIFDEFSTPEVSQKYAIAHGALEAETKASVAGLDAKMHKPAIYVLPAEEKARWAAAVQSVKDEWVAEFPNGQAMFDDLLSLIAKYSAP